MTTAEELKALHGENYDALFNHCKRVAITVTYPTDVMTRYRFHDGSALDKTQVIFIDTGRCTK